MRRRALLAGLGGIGALSAIRAGDALAQSQSYPNRAVTIIVPFAPGGSTDFVARLLAQHLSTRLSGNFVGPRAGDGPVSHRAAAPSPVLHDEVATQPRREMLREQTRHEVG